MARETELKFLVDTDFELPALDSADAGILSVVELPTLALSAIYYDTDDLQLARCGLTLRHRSGEDGVPPWTLKLPVNGGGVTREEITYDAGPGDPPDGATELLTAFVRGRSMAPVTQIKTRRLRWSLVGPAGEDLGELVDDRVSVLNGAAIVQRFREIEVESHGLQGAALERVASAMRQAGASEPDQTPKALRALGTRALAPPDWVVPAPQPQEPVSGAIRLSIATAVRRIITNDPAARLGDPEGVHQMRVGVRRLRSDLRMFEPIVDAVWARDLQGELRWLGDALGPARDMDVLLERLRAQSAGLGEALNPLFAEIERWRAAAGVTLESALGDARYVKLLERLLGDLATPSLLPGASEPCKAAMPALVAEAWRSLARCARKVSDKSSDDDLHSVRIAAKRTRYAAELAAECLDSRKSAEAVRFAKGAEAIQNILGEHQDAAVAQRRLLEVATGQPDNGPLNLALGRLIERQTLAGKDCRRRFQQSWRRFDQKGKRTWLNRRGSR
jgi:CHAD domain-containing protein